MLAARPDQQLDYGRYPGTTPVCRDSSVRHAYRAPHVDWLPPVQQIRSTKKDDMRTPVSDRRPRAGMTLAPRHRQSRPMPMSAVAVRRSRFGEFELRPVRERTVEALTVEEATTDEG